VTLPNFLIIGAQKAGTTSVYEYLSQHPDLFMSTPKEPHFFTYMGGNTPIGGHSNPLYKPQRRITDPMEYERLFDTAGSAVAIGEASPSYLYSPEAPTRIANMIPNVKLIAILRQPADRAFSNFQFNRRSGQEPLESFDAAMAAEDQRVADGWGYAWHYRRKGLYGEQLARYQARFGPEQLRVVLHDDLVRDPAGFVRDLFRFLGVRDDFVPDMTISSNVSGVPRSRVLGTILRPALMVHRYWSPLVPPGMRQALRSRLLTKPKMTPETRAQLTESYRDDIVRTGEMIGRDLGRWLV
jgi:hypothetical protein